MHSQDQLSAYAANGGDCQLTLHYDMLHGTPKLFGLERIAVDMGTDIRDENPILLE